MVHTTQRAGEGMGGGGRTRLGVGVIFNENVTTYSINTHTSSSKPRDSRSGQYTPALLSCILRHI